MMRNSWAPLVAMGAMVVFVLFMLPDQVHRGIEGPQLYNGIYNKLEKFVPGPTADAIQAQVTVTEADDPLAVDALADGRRGFEIVPWDQVAIVLDDRSGGTRAIAKSLAEHLSGHLLDNGVPSPIGQAQRAGLVVLIPMDERTVPLAVRRVIHLRTITHERAESVQETTTGTLQVTLVDAHRPLVQATTGLLPIGGLREGSWQFRYSFACTDDEADWVGWYIGFGRSLAGEIIRTLQAHEPEALVDWSITGDRRVDILARQGFGVISGEDPPPELNWNEVIPWPPSEGVETWVGSWQSPLVRGWTGAIVGTDVAEKHKTWKHQATIERFRKKMERADWEVVNEDETGITWVRKEHSSPFSKLLAAKRGYGWELSAVMEHPHTRRICAAWRNAAKTGDAMARQQLRRHLFCIAAGQDEMQQAKGILQEGAGIGDKAVLGLDPAAESQYRLITAVADYLRGRISTRPAVDSLPEWGPGHWNLSAQPMVWRRPDGLVAMWMDGEARWALVERHAAEAPRWTHGHLAAAGHAAGENWSLEQIDGAWRLAVSSPSPMGER